MSLRSPISCCLSVLTLFGVAACRQAQPRPAESQQSSKAASPSNQEQSQQRDLLRPPVARPAGPIRFVDVTQAAGIHFRHNSGAYGKKYLPETMGSGVCVIDYDGDGWQDILFVNSMDWPEHKISVSTPGSLPQQS